jgi:hypothetical protein
MPPEGFADAHEVLEARRLFGEAIDECFGSRDRLLRQRLVSRSQSLA